MSKCGYICTTGGPVALTAATAKCVIGVKGHANHGLDLIKFRVGFDGVTASAVPVLVELGYCFPSGTLVGDKVPVAIEDAEFVTGHDGRSHKVMDRMSRPYAGPLSVLHTIGSLPIKATPEHPVLVVRPYRFPGGATIKPGTRWHENVGVAVRHFASQPFWLRAKDIEVGDLLVVPRWVQPESGEAVAQEWPFPAFSAKSKQPLPLEPTDDVAWMLGLYAADGSSNGENGIQFVLSPKDDLARLRRVWRGLGIEPWVRDHGTWVAVGINSRIVERTFQSWFGKRDQKRLPAFVFDGWPLAAVLEGLVDGDGYSSNASGRIEYSTISPLLAEQVRSILVAMGESPTIRRRDRLNGYPNAKPAHHLSWTPGALQHRTGWWKGLYLVPVVTVTTEHYEGLVHNLSVEGVESFTVNGVAVHNCTWASNSPGTNSTSTTIVQTYGRVQTNSATSGKTWTTEPTTITVLDEWLLSPNGGLVLYDFPLGSAFDSAVSEGFVLRLTAPAAANARASLHFERC